MLPTCRVGNACEACTGPCELFLLGAVGGTEVQERGTVERCEKACVGRCAGHCLLCTGLQGSVCGLPLYGKRGGQVCRAVLVSRKERHRGCSVVAGRRLGRCGVAVCSEGGQEGRSEVW